MQRPVVDFPQPDSPTSPSVSPAPISKLTAVDGVHLLVCGGEQAAADREMLDQIADPEQRLDALRLAHGRPRSPSR